jgi:hypothetical protein
MKIAACFLVFLAAPLACNASDVSDLASGYASAFSAMNRMTCNLTCVVDGQSMVIKNVKLVKAFGGALLLRQDNGEQMVLSAGSVVRITE